MFPCRRFRRAAVSAVAPLFPLLLRIPAARRRLASAGGHAATGAGNETHRSRAWVTGWKGARALGLMLEGGEGFALAADLAVHALRRHLAHRPEPGTYTPATAYGTSWMDDLSGVRVSDVHLSQGATPWIGFSPSAATA